MKNIVVFNFVFISIFAFSASLSCPTTLNGFNIDAGCGYADYENCTATCTSNGAVSPITCYNGTWIVHIPGACGAGDGVCPDITTQTPSGYVILSLCNDTSVGANCLALCTYNNATANVVCANGTWQGFTTCDAAPTCPMPSLPVGYRTTTSCVGYGAGASCSYTCDAGYTGTPGSVVCDGNNWSNISTSCVPTVSTCPALTVAYPQVISGACGNTNGSVCNVTCAAGYTGGAAPVVCNGYSWTWYYNLTCTADVSTCPALTVAYPQVISGACGNTNGSVCNVTCAAGYTGGAAPVVCNGYSWTWYYNLTCTANVSTCPALNTTNAPFDVVGNCSYTNGSLCTLSCRAGYSGGSTLVRCNNGAWNYDSSWTCQPDNTTGSCLAFNVSIAPEGVYVYGTCGTANGTVCTLRCGSNYSADSTQITCINGVWNYAKAIICRAVCTQPPVIPGYYYYADCSNASAGAVCPYSCDAGYSGQGGSLICNGAYWVENSTAGAGCLPNNASSCTVLTNSSVIYNTMVVGNCSNNNGSVCLVKCRSDYVGNATTIMCVGGAWLYTVQPYCVPANTTNCPSLIVSPPAMIYGSCGVTNASSCYVTCASGYSGSMVTTTCLNGGWRWSAYPNCTSNTNVTCPPLVLPPAYSLASNCSNYNKLGSYCPVVCAAGYSGTPSTVVCGTTGNWSIPTGCIATVANMSCYNALPPGYVINGNCSKASGSYCNLSCDTSAYFGVAYTAYCYNGTWSYSGNCSLICPAYCASINRVSCSATPGACGSCLPGFYSPTGSATDACLPLKTCLNDCAALNRYQCNYTDGYCGGCIYGYQSTDSTTTSSMCNKIIRCDVNCSIFNREQFCSYDNICSSCKTGYSATNSSIPNSYCAMNCNASACYAQYRMACTSPNVCGPCMNGTYMNMTTGGCVPQQTCNVTLCAQLNRGVCTTAGTCGPCLAGYANVNGTCIKCLQNCAGLNRNTCVAPEICGACLAKYVPTSNTTNSFCSINCTSTQTRCWDGSCQDSAMLCSCPPERPLRCGSNSSICVADTRYCPCSTDMPYKCEVDLSCRESKEMCPCPMGMIKCPNYTCASNYSECACGDGFVKCADSSCRLASSNATDPCSDCPVGQFKCSSGVCVTTLAACSCPSTMPAICWNGECQTSPDMCPCRDGYVKCLDGRCMVNQTMCSMIEACPESTPVRCSNMSCVAYVELCFANNNSCPANTSRCLNGSCMAVCDCPSTAPIRCATGSACVENQRYCPCGLNETKCYSGECVSNYTMCGCPYPYVKCQDSSCALSFDRCPCFGEMPYRCYSNATSNSTNVVSRCVASPVDCNCPVGMKMCATGCAYNCSDCPMNTIRCYLDGQCKPESECRKTYCPADAPLLCSDLTTCTSDLSRCPCPIGTTRCSSGVCLAICPVTCTGVVCPDGSCQSSIYECNCTASAPVKCKVNGFCVETEKLCPCPTGMFKCLDGSCSLTLSSCGCITGYHYCNATATCIPLNTTCANVTICPSWAPVYCKDAKACVRSLDQCSCPTGIMCNTTGLCVNSIIDCRCDGYQIRCPDGACRNSSTECTALPPAACSTLTPYRCPNSDVCVKDYFDCPCPDAALPVRCRVGGVCMASPRDCPCESSLPFKCPTEPFECVRNFTECKCLNETGAVVPRCSNGYCPINGTCQVVCPSSAPVKCWDSSCQVAYSMCPCPDIYPFKCNTGRCVKSQADCELNCTGVKCPNGVCASSLMDCACVDPSERRCPPGICVPFNVTVCPSVNVCNSTEPVRCPDGSCKRDVALCTTCPDKMYRCPNGRCVAITTANYSVDALCFSGCNGSTPILCPGTFMCSANLSSCPCPQYMKKCPSGICVPEGEVCEFKCPSTMPVLCPGTSQCVGVFTSCPCLNGLVRCSDGACKASLTECTRYIVNGTISDKPLCSVAGQILCPDLKTCVSDLNLCPGSRCSAGLYTCNSGQCVQTPEDCVTLPNCTTLKPLRCPMSPMTCVLKLDDCPAISRCPSDKPMLCSDQVTCSPANGSLCEIIDAVLTNTSYCSGEFPIRCINVPKCVKNLADCPTDITVSTGYRCSDGTLVRNATECKSNCTVVCPGGGCSSTSTLDGCPSMITCPVGKIKCSTSSACVDYIEQCSDSFVCAAGMIQCPNSKLCMRTISDCPTTGSCPLEKPILCANMKDCVTTAAECVEILPCPTTLPYRCLDGSCKMSQRDCSSVITCPVIKCAETGKCVNSIQECSNETIVACTAGFIKCQDGSCVKPEVGCIPTPVCRLGEVLCGDLSCRASRDLCPTVSCQTGTRWCSSIAYCINETKTCPTPEVCGLATPVRCPSGQCVKLAIDCLNNTCNNSTHIKCNDGRCLPVNESDMCSPPSVCPTGLLLCSSDKSCVRDPSECLRIPPCPVAGMIRCKNMSCVDSESQCLSVNVSCSAGQVWCITTSRCVSSSDECNISTNACPAGFIRCSTGARICVPSAADCLPPVDCGVVGYVRCLDGMCRNATDPCPTVVPSCGDGKKLCANAECIDANMNCSEAELCPVGLFKCPNGECMKFRANCTLFTSTSGYTICANGARVSSPSLCPAIPPCKDNEVRCNSTGRCVVETENCDSITTPVYQYCPFRCEQTGACVDNLTLCVDPVTGCPASHPVRCETGRCVSSSSQCINVTQCPEDAPVKCELFKECVADAKLCKLPNGCTLEFPKRCLDSCVGALDSCTVAECPTGQLKCAGVDMCVSSIGDCVNSLGCPLATPVRCANSSCVTDAKLCAPVIACDTGIVCDNGRCVVSLDQCDSFVPRCENDQVWCAEAYMCINADAECVRGCPPASAFRCESDGSCVSDPSLCPKPLGCDLTKPYKCSDSTCVEKPSDCVVMQDVCAGVICPTGECVNDIKLCKPISACPDETPILCPSGRCVADVAACGTFDVCDKTLCVTGECVDDYSSCPRICPIDKTLCGDGSCRGNEKACPPTLGCLPGEKLCSKSVCVPASLPCGHAKPNGQCENETVWCAAKKSCLAAADCVELFEPKVPIISVTLYIHGNELAEIPVRSEYDNEILAVIIPLGTSFPIGTKITLTGVSPANSDKISGNRLSIQFELVATLNGEPVLLNAPVMIRIPSTNKNGKLEGFMNQLCIGYAKLDDGSTDISQNGDGKYVCEDSQLKYDSVNEHITGATGHFTTFSLIENIQTQDKNEEEAGDTLNISIVTIAGVAGGSILVIVVIAVICKSSSKKSELLGGTNFTESSVVLSNTSETMGHSMEPMLVETHCPTTDGASEMNAATVTDEDFK